MISRWRDFVQDERGVIISAELVIVLTVAVLGMVVGLSNLQQGILSEFNDLTMAFQSLNQSYATASFRGCWKFWGPTSWFAGSRFIDFYDGCFGYSTGVTGGFGNYGGAYYGGDIVGSSDYVLPAAPVNSCPTDGRVLTTPATPTLPLPVPPSDPIPSTNGCATCQ